MIFNDSNGLLFNPLILFVIDSGFTIFAIVYFLFSLIVIRQVFLMTKTVETEAGSTLRFLSFIHSGIALAVVVLFITIL